jgi:predicted metal-dependent phosphoesterase TrpH
MHLDLHVHSTCSDGAVAPAELVALARRAGLGAVAIADHDSTAAVKPARAAAAAVGAIAVVTATEITCGFDGAELHLLAYGFRMDHPGMAALARSAAAARLARMDAMVERLRELGVALARDDVVAPPECASIGRVHLARALVRRGAAGSIADAFQRFIGDRAPGFVASRGPDVADAIAAVGTAGGIAVWAHPSLDDVRHFARLRDAGLQGVEAFRPSLDGHASASLVEAARETGLLVTGGSDWHGGTRPALGAWYVTERHVGAFLEQLGELE